MSAPEVELIVAMYAGSRLYGTSTPESDVDIRGVCMPTVESVLGLSPFEQFQPKEKVAREWSRETLGIEADDVTIYALPKFFSLLLGANPNIAELLFAPDETILHRTPLWDEIVANKSLFLSQKIVHTFAGYAYSQLQRIQRHKRWLDDPPERPNPADYMGEFVDGAWKWREPTKDEINHVMVSSIRYAAFDPDVFRTRLDDLYRRAARRKEYDADLRDWQHYQTWQKNRNPARAKLEAKYSLDVKHAMHLVRLDFEAEQLLMSGKIEFPLPPAQLSVLRDVLNGRLAYDEVIQFAEDIDGRLGTLRETTELPNSPDRKGAERLLMKVLGEWLGEKR